MTIDLPPVLTTRGEQTGAWALPALAPKPDPAFRGAAVRRGDRPYDWAYDRFISSGRQGGARKSSGTSIFSPVSIARISEVIVEQVRLLMLQGLLRPGDRLPPERELCQRFGVSRVTVREALRVLDAGGLIDVRVGARGGAFVTAPSSQRVGVGITDLLTMSALCAGEVTEARFVFELGIVSLVCERATATDIEELREICSRSEQALDDGEYQMTLSAEFHTRVAQSSHNGAIELLVQSFRGPLLMSLEHAQQAAPDMGGRGVTEHKAFVEAVEARDAELASTIMSDHLRRTAERLGVLPLDRHYRPSPGPMTAAISGRAPGAG